MSRSTFVPNWPQDWRAEILAAPPLIAPARQFVYPRQIAGEEDALSRGASQVMVHPVTGGDFLATFALGFNDRRLPSGIWSCPNPRDLCAVAGGYAYLLDTTSPQQAHLLEMRPVVEILQLASHGLLVFAGLHALSAWGTDGLAWHTARLTWEGLSITGIEGDELHGLGWDLHTDREIPFQVDLKTGAHRGGPF